MTKFISAIPSDNYILHTKTDNSGVFNFNVLTELKRIPLYKRLYDADFFKQVHFKAERIYWDYDHDFHIDQVLARVKKIN